MVHGDAPAGVVVRIVENIVSVPAIVHPGALHARHLVAEVAACHVERDGVESGEHADVGDDRGVVFRMAVAVRRDVADEADVEIRLAVHDGGGVFGHFLVERLGGLRHGGVDGVDGAHAEAAAASGAGFAVEGHLFRGGVEMQGVVRALFETHFATDAEVAVELRLAVAVHRHFARARGAAHGEVLDRAAHAGQLVALEVVQRDDHVRVGDGAADLRGLEVDAVRDGEFDLVVALQPVADDHVAARGERAESVEVGGLEVFQRVFAVARIERVAVGQERLSAALLHEIGDDLRVVRAQERQVAELAEVHFDRDELVAQVERLESGFRHEVVQFVGQGRAVHFRAEVAEIDFLGHAGLLNRAWSGCVDSSNNARSEGRLLESCLEQKGVGKGYVYNSTPNPNFKSIIGKNIPLSKINT